MAMLLSLLSLWTNASAFLPAAFKPPVSFTLNAYSFRKISPDWADKDYQALMAARQVIRQKLGTDWPSDTFTAQENRATIIDDAAAFDARTRLTYSVFDAENRVVGSLYISPVTNEKDEVTGVSVFFWLRPDITTEKEYWQLLAVIQQHLSEAWPFSEVDYSLNGTR